MVTTRLRWQHLIRLSGLTEPGVHMESPMEKSHIELSQTRSMADGVRFLNAAHSIKLTAANWRIIMVHGVPKALVNKLLGGAKRTDHHEILRRNNVENRNENNNPKFKKADMYCLDAAIIRALQLDPDDNADAAAGASPSTAKDAEEPVAASSRRRQRQRGRRRAERRTCRDAGQAGAAARQAPQELLTTHACDNTCALQHRSVLPRHHHPHSNRTALHTQPCHTLHSASPVHPTAHQRHRPARRRRAGPSASYY